MDMEARAHSEHPEALRLWLRLLTCTQLIEKQVRSRLREQFDTTLPRFDLMAQLERQPEGLRMGELSKRMMVTGGNVTGIVAQLEAEGLVARVPDAQDGRAFMVTLTPSGRRTFAQMATVHERWVAELFDDIPAADQARMIALLDAMKRRLNDNQDQE